MKKTHITILLLLISSLFLSACSDKSSYSDSSHGTSSMDISETSISSLQSTNSVESTAISEQSLTKPASSAESNTENSEPQTESSDEKHEPVPVEFTDEDIELQEILSELYEPTSAINRWFCRLMVSNAAYPDAHGWRLKIPEISFEGEYIQVPENYYLVSESFCVPTTKAGMRELFQKYFTKERTDNLMERYQVCDLIERSDKTLTLKFKTDDPYEFKLHSLYFIEADGHLYAADGYGTFGFIVPETAKITKKTDDTIEFTFLMSNDIWPEYLGDTSLYLEAAQNGSIKLEDGVWKLHTWDEWNFPLEPRPY